MIKGASKEYECDCILYLLGCYKCERTIKLGWMLRNAIEDLTIHGWVFSEKGRVKYLLQLICG